MLKKRIQSFKYAFAGIGHFVRSEVNARIHLFAGLTAIGMGFLLEINSYEWCLIILAIGLVLTAEALNTALEYLTNLVSPDFHPLAGKAKDVAAGAVLLSSISAAVVGLIIFLPKLLLFFS